MDAFVYIGDGDGGGGGGGVHSSIGCRQDLLPMYVRHWLKILSTACPCSGERSDEGQRGDFHRLLRRLHVRWPKHHLVRPHPPHPGPDLSKQPTAIPQKCPTAYFKKQFVVREREEVFVVEESTGRKGVADGCLDCCLYARWVTRALHALLSSPTVVTNLCSVTLHGRLLMRTHDLKCERHTANP